MMNCNGLRRRCYDFVRIACPCDDLLLVENLPMDTGGYRVGVVMVEEDEFVVLCQFMHRNMVAL